MSAQKIERITIHIDYVFDGQLLEDEQNHAAERVASDRWRLLSSSGFLADYMLYYGDEIIVEPLADNKWRFIKVLEPSAMALYFFIGSAPPKPITEVLHRMGGEWECDMGGFTHFHIPKANFVAFSDEIGIRFDNQETAKSGLRNLDD